MAPQHAPLRHRAFSLLELMAVVTIILILTATTALMFANGRPAVRVKKDAGQMVAFLRNMWDRTRATSAPLVLEPNFEDGSFRYSDPYSGKTVKAQLSDEVHVIALKLNDRLYSRFTWTPMTTYDQPEDGDGALPGERDTSIYLSEGRGLTRISVIFGIPRDEEVLEEGYDFIYICTLNLITGKGQIELLDDAELESIFQQAEDATMEDVNEPTMLRIP